MKKRIYFDNAATTRCYDEVLPVLRYYLYDCYANASSLHDFGLLASKAQRKAARALLDLLGIPEERTVIFTSGATEASNLAIRGTMERSKTPFKLITTTVEHPATQNVFRYYEQKGYPVAYVPVDGHGMVDENKLIEQIDEHTRLVSMILTHNELGVVQPFEKLARLIKQKNPDTLVHIDAVQWVGREKSSFADVDMISMSAHKIHGPKGIGALVVKRGMALVAQMLGGEQQNGLRSGTIPTPLIAALGETCRIAQQTFVQRNDAERTLRDYFYQGVMQRFGTLVQINTPMEAHVSPHILSVSFPGLKGEVLLHMLESEGIYVSTASACSSAKMDAHSVLRRFGLAPAVAEGTLRFSFSSFNTKQEIDYALDVLERSVYKLKIIAQRAH